MAQDAADRWARLGLTGDARGPAPTAKAVVGAGQPTLQSVSIAAGACLFMESIKGEDHGGDSTVYRQSAAPPGVTAFPLPQKHGALAKSSEALTFVVDKLTGADTGPPLGTRPLGAASPTSPTRKPVSRSVSLVRKGIRWASVWLTTDLDTGRATTWTDVTREGDDLCYSIGGLRPGLHRVEVKGGGSGDHGSAAGGGALVTVTVITVGLDHYDRQPGWDIPEAAESRARVGKLFVEHGAVAEDWTPSANRRDIATVLDKWTDRFTDSHIIYWVGHGEYSDDGYMAALADSTDPLSSLKALNDDHLKQAVRAWTAMRNLNEPDSWLLLILDTCGSAPGAWKVYRSFNERRPTLVSSQQEVELPSVGAWRPTWSSCLAGFSGNDSAGISLKELAQAVRRSPRR